MGRKKIAIEPIEDKSSRRVAFSKRRAGLIKKARDLSVLCDAEVALVVFSPTGGLSDFSTGDSLARIVQRFENQSTEEERCSTSESRPASSPKIFSELLEIVNRPLEEEPELGQLSAEEVQHLDERISAALTRATTLKTERTTKSLLEFQERVAKLKEEIKSMKELAAASSGPGGNEAGQCSSPREPKLLQLF